MPKLIQILESEGDVELGVSVKALKEKKEEEWFGIDFDGTLAEYDKWRGPFHTGEPIKATVAWAKRQLKAGKKLKVFTARVANPDQAEVATKAIKKWCKTHLGKELEVTNEKDQFMIGLRDDKLKLQRVITNTGELVK